jgi:hypothetical protein
VRNKDKFKLWWNDLTNEKKAVFASFIILIAAFSMMALSMEFNKVQVNHRGNSINSFSSSLPIEFAAAGDMSTNPSKLKAMVKGSIYENGSNMTVYGACFTGDGFLLPGADTYFTAWYPDGTIMIGPNATMDRVYQDLDDPLGNETTRPNGTGRWKIHVTMGDVIGTYLTEIRCMYEGDFAVAFGEWQNPEWVKRIELTQDTVNLNYALLQQVANDTQNNFSQITELINNMTSNLSQQIGSGSTSIDISVSELENVLRDIDKGYWLLDLKNPFYVVGSGVHQFTAVDMISPNRVVAVSSDGYYVVWDGETWQETLVSGANFNGVSVLPAAGIYAWAVGDDSSDPTYSINGGALVVPTLPGGTPNTFNDVKVFQDPNNPALYFHVVVLGDDGSIYRSDDGGSNWAILGTSIDSGSIGRMSDVVENYVSGAPVDGFVIALVQGEDFAVYDGSSVSTISLSGVTFSAVDLLYGDLGYAVGTNSTHTIIFKYNGTALIEEYSVADSMIVPTGVEMHSQNDVWVTTSNPDLIYRFNGRTWEYGLLGSSQFSNIVVSFNNLTGAGLTDVSMANSRSGYAVGSDGVIFVFKTQSSNQFDLMMSAINNISFNDTNILNSIQAVNQSINSYLFDVNASLSGDILNMQSFLNQMNATIDYKLDNILFNITFTQLYLETTIFPILNSTYENTLLILTQLGVIEAKVNETIQLQNTTLGIVNQTQQDVDLLVNRSNKIRAWITQ